MGEIELINSEEKMTDMKRASSSGNKACSAMHELEVAIKTFHDSIEILNAYIEENMANMKRTSSSGDKASSHWQKVLEDQIAKLKKHAEEKERTVKVKRYKRLIRMMIENNVEAQRDFLNKNPDALTAEIDDFGNTIFHFIVQEPPNMATIKLLRELVLNVSAETLKKVNVNRLTALHNAACAGNTAALQVFGDKNQSLLSIEDEHRWLLIHHAAFWGREKTVQYLLSNTDHLLAHENSNSDLFDSQLLLDLLVDSNLHDLALELLKKHPHLATPDENPRWMSTVNKLAEKPLAFKSGGERGILESLIYSYIHANDDDQDHVTWPPLDDDIEMQNNISTNDSKISLILPQRAATIGALEQKLYTLLWNILIHLVPYIKRIHDQKHMHSQTLKLVRMMISNVTWTYNKATENLKEPVLTASRLGIHEFVNEVLKAFPYSVLFCDKEGRNIFLLAVLHRKENVFCLIHDQMASIKDHSNYIRDIYGHNILHLAGKVSVPPSHVPGAALQMQKELQWFMGIRSIFQPWLQKQQNEDGLTPRELFTIKHGDLMEKGEKWMRDTATSCSVVGGLIITTVFAAAFTVPGGFDPKGAPIYLHKIHFRIFAVLIALALFASITSMQMFLGMLTSRYAEDDFLKALPTKLIRGLVTLFLSSTSMMVAFGAAFCLVFSQQWKWAIILMGLGCLPLTLFASMQFHLLVEFFVSTYGPGILASKKHV